MELSSFQQAILDEWTNTNHNLAIEAGPGSGKTFMLLQLAKTVKMSDKAIFLAFNKSIAEELSKKLPFYMKAMTLHSLGMRTLLRVYGFSVTVKEDKTFLVCKKYFDQFKFYGEHGKDFKKKMAYVFSLAKVYDMYRFNMVEDISELKTLCVDYDIPALGDIDMRNLETMIHIMDTYNSQLSSGEMVDFTDMLWLCKDIPKSKFQQFDKVFVDECQDLNSLQRMMVEKILSPKGRLVAVGDSKQCQPTGTKILLWNGSEKFIEDVVVGDKVVTYNAQRTASFQGYYESERSFKHFSKNDNINTVTEVAKRKYKGDLIKIIAGGDISMYTPDHRCYVKWKESSIGKYCVYLMNKGSLWRIGMTPLWSKKGFSGLIQRIAAEKADKAWILRICKTRDEALFYEEVYSYNFDIPQNVFEARGSVLKLGQEGLDAIWKAYDENKMIDGAYRLISHLGLYIEAPFYLRKDFNYNSKNHMFNVYAGNIFSEYMQVIKFDKKAVKIKSRGKKIVRVFCDIDSMEKVPYEGYVYSLNISGNHNYIADNILTHNCIYLFAGASLSNFNALKERPNTVTLPLSITYRCAKNIVDRANTVFEGLLPVPAASDGIVERGTLDEIKEGDFVLCRNNKPLVQVYIKLLKKDIKASIYGKDYEKKLLKLLDKCKDVSDIHQAKDILLNERILLINDLKSKGYSNPEMHPSVGAFDEAYQILEILFDEKGVQGSRKMIEKMFKDDVDSKSVMLMTCHKSKGLEAERVFFLNEELIPSKYAESPQMLYAEKCLAYVTITRAKSMLKYIHIGDGD